jgi:hypothetical protein
VVSLATDARAALGDNGVLFRMTVMGEGIDFDNDAGTWMRRSGEFLMFQHEGHPAPGMGDPRITVRVGNSIPEINGLGHSVHSFRIQGPGIDSTNESVDGGLDIADFAIFFQQGDPMFISPAGTLVGLPGNDLVDLAGFVTFMSTLTGPDVDTSNHRVLYKGIPTDFSILIRSGDPVPAGNDGDIFSLQPESTSAKITRNENGEMAISAFYRESTSMEFFEAVWLHDFATGEWTQLFSEGEIWDGVPAPSTDPGPYFNFNSGTSGERIGLADDGTLGINMDYPMSDERIYMVQVITLGDYDEDGDVDLVDFAAFQTCFTGPGNLPSASCRVAFDSDDDADIDLADFGNFQLSFTGPF